MLEVTPSTALTDHKAPTKALPANWDNYSPRELRHLQFISQFTYNLRHVKGKNNEVVDSLSRMRIDYEHLSNLQRDDADLKKIMSSKTTSLSLETIPFGTIKVICDTSTGKFPTFVPTDMRHTVFEKLHNL
ncbi:unnamed protein product [Trichobilharzia regenti]|nr:unnamed protein product [Trichobilharzia regenti]